MAIDNPGKHSRIMKDIISMRAKHRFIFKSLAAPALVVSLFRVTFSISSDS